MLLFRTASVFNVGTAVTLKTLKLGRTTLNCAYFASAFGVSKVVKLDTYESRRKNAAQKLKSATEELRLKIISSLDTMNSINSRDVQELIFTAEPQDLELIVASLKKLELQSERMRFSNFNMDAVVMRMYTYLKLPEEACNTFLDEDFKKLFVGYNSIVILLDLLYSNESYEKLLECVDCLERRQNFNVWSSRGVAAFYITSCLKINTPDTLMKGLLHFEKILKYREAAPGLVLLAIVVALRCQPQKVDVFLKLLRKNSKYSDFKTNVKLQQLTSMGHLSDVEEYLLQNKCLLAKDTHDLIMSLSVENKSDRLDKIIKDCKICDTSLVDWAIEENHKELE